MFDFKMSKRNLFFKKKFKVCYLKNLIQHSKGIFLKECYEKTAELFLC